MAYEINMIKDLNNEQFKGKMMVKVNNPDVEIEAGDTIIVRGIESVPEEPIIVEEVNRYPANGFTQIHTYFEFTGYIPFQGTVEKVEIEAPQMADILPSKKVSNKTMYIAGGAILALVAAFIIWRKTR